MSYKTEMQIEHHKLKKDIKWLKYFLQTSETALSKNCVRSTSGSYHIDIWNCKAQKVLLKEQLEAMIKYRIALEQRMMLENVKEFDNEE